MKKRLPALLTLSLIVLLPQSALAWNGVGHEVVARIAWENMTPTARRNVVALLQAAPDDACLLDLFPGGTRPLDERQREFFMLASTWPDVVRPGRNDTRPCTRFHERDWHFINFFWEGISGDTAEPPRDRLDIETPSVNAVERLGRFRTFVVGSAPRAERATRLAWVLHLVGDIHQPLHTSARVTSLPGERRGDQGGNLFKLGPSNNSLSLHSYWDGIVDRSIRRRSRENDSAYFERIARAVMQRHPRSEMLGRLRPGNFEAWAREGFETTKRSVYPRSLRRGRLPSDNYRARAFRISEEAIALGGYRLADLLNQMFGS